MSFAKYAQFYKDNGFFAGSKIKCTVTDTTFIGEELILSKDNEVIRSMTIPTSGKVEFFTDESGELTLSADNGTSTISGTVEIGAYATYEVILNGSASDTTREVYADKENVVFDDDVTSDTVNISYTGDVSNLTVKSSNTNIATATLNGNKVNVVDAGSGMMGKTDITVTVAKTRAYQEKNININVTKTNGTLDKTTWKGLKNIVESGREAELCQVGDEIDVTLSNGRTMIYVIGAIDHDYDHQLIFVPKSSLMFSNDGMPFDISGANTQWKECSLRAYLNGTFIDMLPQEVKAVISERATQYASDATTLVDVTDKIWLPKEIEVLTNISGSYAKEQEIPRISQFKCFTDKIIDLHYFGDDRDNSWSMSPSRGTSRYIITVEKNGSTSNFNYQSGSYSVTATRIRVIPCFHIIKET